MSLEPTRSERLPVGPGAKSALGGVNPESDIELEAARAHVLQSVPIYKDIDSGPEVSTSL